MEQGKIETIPKTRALTLIIDGTLQESLKASRSFSQNFVTDKEGEARFQGSASLQQCSLCGPGFLICTHMPLWVCCV